MRYGKALLIILLFSSLLNGCRKRDVCKLADQLQDTNLPDIRVLLLNDVNQCQLDIDGGFEILDCNESKIEPNELSVSLKIRILKDKLSVNGTKLESGCIFLVPQKEIFDLDGQSYRGTVKLAQNKDSNSFDVINVVPLENYLAGVVGAEMYSYWEMQALKAQAVVARTYCLYIKRRFGTGRNWDVKKSQAHQAYHGIRAETLRINKAVSETTGEVLACEQDGVLDIFPSYYSSNCGGHTEDSTNVFGGKSLKPLKGVECPFCRKVAKARFFDWQEVIFEKSNVNDRLMKRYPILKELDSIEKLEPMRKSDYDDFSRLTFVKLIGSNGKSDSLRAEDLRLAIDSGGLKIKSASCRISDVNDMWVFSDGRGYGHGVGLCQCGAEYIARCGKDYREILLYYYPGSEILKLFKDD